jgi:enoyl-CoA hydratase
VHGHAIGAGCTLAMICDYFVLSRDTSLGFPELRHGLTPGMTFPQLQRLAGPRRAMDLILSGASISAEEAVASGIASETVEREDLDQTVADLAARIAGYDPEPVRAIKRLARAVDAMPPAAAEAAGVDAVIIRRLHTQQGAAV